MKKIMCGLGLIALMLLANNAFSYHEDLGDEMWPRINLIGQDI